MKRAHRIAVWSAVALALALATWARIYLVDHLHDQGWFTKYVVFADRILAGDIPTDRIGDVSPLYLWSMVVLRAFHFGLRAIRDLQIIGLTVAALLCALAAKRFGGWTAAITAALLILGSRAALVIATEVEPDTLILVLNAAAIFLLARRNWIFAGFLIGLSAVARPVALLILLAVAISQSRRVMLLLVSAALVPIAIVLIVNASLTGNLFIMQPGAQLYEGNNPLATGCAGVMPRIVADLNVSVHEPDYLHVAYRIVAARAMNEPVNAKDANRYWTAKTLAYLRTYPRAMFRLLAWKAVLAVHHYDIYDLITTKRKSEELTRIPAIPFGVAFVLSIAAFVLSARRRELLPFAFFAAATIAALVLFNVSARQRDALLPPLAMLGGIGAAEIVALARTRSEKALIAFGAVVVITPILGIEGPPMREDHYNWDSTFRASAYRAEARRAHERGDVRHAVEFGTGASILDTSEPPIVSGDTLRLGAQIAAQNSESPPLLFDAAIALEKASAWPQADFVLKALDDYEPRRENRAVSSVSYYRARAALHLDPRSVRALLDAAEREAPGDPNVLALRAVTFDRDALRRLDALHDPFTRDFALANAYLDLGDRAHAIPLLLSLAKNFPEWQRPQIVLRHALRTEMPRSGSSGVGR